MLFRKIVAPLSLGLLTAGLLFGCGGSGSFSLSKPPKSLPSGLWLSQVSIGTIDRWQDITGADPVRFNIASAGHMVFDSQGNLYYHSIFTDQVHKLDPDGVITSYGATGSGTGQFDDIRGIAVDSLDRIYLADTNNRRIVRIDDITGANWVELDVTGQTFPSETYAIDIDSADNIYMITRFGQEIHMFEGISDNTPTTLSPTGADDINDATDIHIGHDGKIYVANGGNHNIVRFDSITDNDGDVLGTQGSGVNQFDGPSTITTTATNQIYIYDTYNNRIVRINDMSGSGWTTGGVSGVDPGQLASAYDLAYKN